MSLPVYIKQERRQEATQELNNGSIEATTTSLGDMMRSSDGSDGWSVHLPRTGETIFTRWPGVEPFPIFGGGALTFSTRQDAINNTIYQGTNQGIKRSFKDMMETTPDDGSSIICNCPDVPCPLTLLGAKLAMIAPWLHFWTTMAWVNPSPRAVPTVHVRADETNRIVLRANIVEVRGPSYEVHKCDASRHALARHSQFACAGRTRRIHLRCNRIRTPTSSPVSALSAGVAPLRAFV
jgi:hypothetical protein